MKICSSCKTEKPKIEYHNNKNAKDGKSSSCKVCTKSRSLKYHYEKVRNNESADLKIRTSKIISEAKNKGEIHYFSLYLCGNCGTSKRLVSTNQCSKCLQLRKESLKTNEQKKTSKNKKISLVKRRTAINLGKNKYTTGLLCIKGHDSPRLVSTRQCTECLKERGSKPYIKPKTKPNYEKVNAKRRSRAGRVRNREYYKNTLVKSPEFKMAMFMRACIRRLFITKNETSAIMLGYSKSDLALHLSELFTDGMTFGNYGEWHIDHIKSIKSFIDEGVNDPKIINALSNLQPLWVFDNLSKGSN